MIADKDTSGWFENNLHVLPVSREIDVVGARLNLLLWGDIDKPGLLFVHGGAAHAGWWRFIAPFFLPEYRCVALDLSGHGSSEHRDIYPDGIWAAEVSAVMNNRDLFRTRPVVIGHSMGGLTGIRVATETWMPGLIVIDAAVRQVPTIPGKTRRGSLLGRDRLYASRQDALQSFRLIPPQPTLNPEIVTYLAETSIRQVAGGWTWLFDPDAFRQVKPSSLYDILGDVTCPVVLVRGEKSQILDRETAAAMREQFGGPCLLVDIPHAFHHVMIDQPLALVSLIRVILAQWSLLSDD